AEDEQIYDFYVQRHELAHALYGMEEAGADYVAAVETLRQYPGAAPDVLQLAGDMRLSQILIAGDVNVFTVMRYGYEPYLAIQQALALDPDSITAIPDEDVLEEARRFDGLAER